MSTRYSKATTDDAVPFTKIDHGVDRRETEETAEINQLNKDSKTYKTFMDLLNDTPDDRYVYLGAKEGSGWIFIAQCSNMKDYLKKINKVCSKKYKEYVRKGSDGPWVNFEERKVVDFYPRITPGDNGICVIVEGKFPGKNWTLDEQIDNYRKDRAREEKLKKEKEKEEAKKQQELEFERRKKQMEEEEREAQLRYEQEYKEHEKYYNIMDCM